MAYKLYGTIDHEVITMPKEGFDSITISEELSTKISQYLGENEGIIPNKSQAIAHAWQLFEHISQQEKNPKPVRIGNRLVGPNEAPFLIAEVGINHNGDVELAKKLIDLAAKYGWDAVKFQKRTIDKVYTKEELAKPRENPFGATNGDLKRGLEFDEKAYKEIDMYCKEKGVMWFASPWDLDSVDFLEKFQVPCYKVGSPSLTDIKLLLKIKETGKPVVLSTGMSTMKQIHEAVRILGEENVILMQCTSTYPCEPHELDLHVITTFRKTFNCPIGYSGHEINPYPSIVAVGLGACAIERHITLDRSMFGSDQAASLEARGMELVAKCRQVPSFMGSKKKRVFDSEIPIMKKLRKVTDF
ncbi:MAG: N-acetylneuraminate synthase family protein [Nanoarchaeota archaeon]